MSEYIHFFVRTGDSFCPIATYCRSSQVFQLMRRAPYEHITVLSKETLMEFRIDAMQQLNSLLTEKGNYETKKQLIASFNNTVEEKIEAMKEYDLDISELNCDINDATNVVNFIDFLNNIIEEVQYESYMGIDRNRYLYYGRECYRPTVQDVV